MNKLVPWLLISIFSVWFIAMLELAGPLFVFKYHDVDPAFKPYVTEFYDLLDKTCPNKKKYQVNYYTIQFADSPNPADWVGMCKPAINGYSIDIDRNYWEQLNKTLQQELMFHELSHCVIYVAHVDNPDNYMYPSLRNLSSVTVKRQVLSNMQAYCDE